MSCSDLMAVGWPTTWFLTEGLPVLYAPLSVTLHVAAVSSITAFTYIVRSILVYLSSRHELSTQQRLAALRTAERLAMSRPDALAVEIVMEKRRVTVSFQSSASHPLSSQPEDNPERSTACLPTPRSPSP
jgi:hypothetical protein